MNVLVICGHPRKNSLSGAFTEAYVSAAGKTGASLQTLFLTDLSFDPNVHHVTPHLQILEPDIQRAQELIHWANHIVFIYPTWWGTMPALMKAFLDRVLTSGFAFEEIEGGIGYAPLLRGRSAQIITTMDTPFFVYKFIYGSPGHKAMRKPTLQFCGFNMGKTLNFGPVRYSTKEKRERWIKKVADEGAKLKRGALSGWKKTMILTGSWLKAIRLQFYPMTFIAYTAGAYAATKNGYGFDSSIFWLVYAWIFFVELATVLTNDYIDYKSDAQNELFSPFTGGSRVLVDRLLSFRQMIKGIVFSLVASIFLLSMLLVKFDGSLQTALLLCGSLFVLALGYTTAPLKLSYRGLGEVTVGITHSFAVILCGYFFQGATITDSFPWLMSLPLFFAVLPSITLSGIPDYDADKAVSKKTLAVQFGKKGAARFAIVFTILSMMTVILFAILGILPSAFNGILFAAIPHAILNIVLLSEYIKNPSPPARIDSLMIASLTYIIWFGVIPLLNLR